MIDLQYRLTSSQEGSGASSTCPGGDRSIRSRKHERLMHDFHDAICLQCWNSRTGGSGVDFFNSSDIIALTSRTRSLPFRRDPKNCNYNIKYTVSLAKRGIDTLSIVLHVNIAPVVCRYEWSNTRATA